MANFKQELSKKLLVALLMIAIFLAGLIFLGWDINRRAQTIKNQRQELADRSAKMSLFAQLQSQSAQADSYRGILENILPNRDQLFDFSKELERLAKQTGLGFGFSFGSETSSSPTQPGRLKFVITVQGSFSKILDFIKNIEVSRFLINFESFDFSGMEAKINGEVLFQ
jgi:Tfp pilus assembly protein PilO